MTGNQLRLLRYSLAFVWLFTAYISAFASKSTGIAILVSADFSHQLANILVLSGSIIDFAIGCWVLSARFQSLCYLVQIAIITIYTGLLTWIDSSFWLHPFGPITKNLPLLAILWILFEQDKKQRQLSRSERFD